MGVLLPLPTGAETPCMLRGSIRWQRLLLIGVIGMVAVGAATLRTMRRGSGVPRWSTGNRAYAAVEIGTERADVITLGFGLSREANDRWRIEELYDLGWKPKGLK